MNRLTNKDFNGNYYSYTTQGNYIEGCFTRENKEWFYGNVVNKLGKLEDIEEDLGCPLEVVIKALKDGFYFKYKDKILSSNEYSVQTRTNIRGNWVFVFDSNNLTLLTIKIKDYGNTWWLSEPKED